MAIDFNFLDVFPKSGGLGNYLLGMKLVDEKGADADYARVVLRAVIKHLPWSIFFMPRKQAKNRNWIKGKYSQALNGVAALIFVFNNLVALITMFTGRFHWDSLTGLYVGMKPEKHGKELFVAG